MNAIANENFRESGRTPRYWAIVLIVLLGISGCSGSSLPVQRDPRGLVDTLQAAKDSFFKLDVKTARTSFEAAFNETSRPQLQRAEAARNLAHIAWRFDKEYASADHYLRRAEELAPGDFETVVERTRLLADQGQLVEAATLGRQARSVAATREERIESGTLVGQLLLQRLAGSAKSIEEQRSEMRVALDALLPTISADPGRLDIAQVGLSLALRLDDGPALLESWRAYYQVPGSMAEAPERAESEWDYPMMNEAHLTLSRILPDWKGPAASTEDRNGLVSALAASKFFADAAWLASDHRVSLEITKTPEVRDILAYAEFLEQVEEMTARLYRLRALGETAHPGLDEELRAAARILWNRLHFPGQRPAFSDQRFWEEISERFGAQVYFRSDGGGRAVHLGHRVIDERREVEQYGRRTMFRFAVLDSLATNGYSSWFWDGRAATGGWVDRDGTVVQVRPSYSSNPLEAWSDMTDPEARKKMDKEIREKSAGDEARALQDPAAYLPGLALRLKRQSLMRLLDQLQAQGLKDQELKVAFVSKLGRLIRASSIYAHEGRHALEKQNVPSNWMRSGAEKEFLAKLSEVGLAPDPRLALTGGILSPNIGDGSSHGQANQRIIRGLVAWMKDHATEIEGLDESRPLLPQLDLLSDEQLRTAVRSQDPWAP